MPRKLNARVIDAGINYGPNKRKPLVHKARIHPRTNNYEHICMAGWDGHFISFRYVVTDAPITCTQCKELS